MINNATIVHSGDRIAQMIIEKVTETQIEVRDVLPSTERGDLGFGSTGVQAKITVDTSQRVGKIVEDIRTNGSEQGVKIKKVE